MFGTVSTILIIVTLIWVIAILVSRHKACVLWRTKLNRRKESIPVENDRRRCSRCPIKEQCISSGRCTLEEHK